MLLDKEENNYYINRKINFTENKIDTDVINLSFDFAYQMLWEKVATEHIEVVVKN